MEGRHVGLGKGEMDRQGSWQGSEDRRGQEAAVPQGPGDMTGQSWCIHPSQSRLTLGTKTFVLSGHAIAQGAEASAGAVCSPASLVTDCSCLPDI